MCLSFHRQVVITDNFFLLDMSDMDRLRFYINNCEEVCVYPKYDHLITNKLYKILKRADMDTVDAGTYRALS